MSSSDRLLLILHVGFAIFTLGPLTAATHATPRYIRRRDVAVLRYLTRATRIYGLAALGILLFGILLAGGDFTKAYLTVSITLFVVALVLLLLIERDQRRAIHALQLAAAEQIPAAVPGSDAAELESGTDEGPKDEQRSEPEETPRPAADAELAKVERGRIASMSGVVSLIWLVTLFLMIWYD
jgi:hypothetical protein